jgi:hypothetical protein
MKVGVLRDLLPSAAIEYEKACKLHDAGFLTEAGLRLGRAVEAALYSIAREMDVSLTDKVIKDIEKVQDGLTAKSSTIMRRSKDASQVRGLADVSKLLSEAIASLIGDESLRMGIPSKEPKRTGALFSDLLQLLDDEDKKNKLNRHRGLLGPIMDVRNKAAHADPSGNPRELSVEEYRELLGVVDEFLTALVHIAIGTSATKQSRTAETT